MPWLQARSAPAPPPPNTHTRPPAPTPSPYHLLDFGDAGVVQAQARGPAQPLPGAALAALWVCAAPGARPKAAPLARRRRAAGSVHGCRRRDGGCRAGRGGLSGCAEGGRLGGAVVVCLAGTEGGAASGKRAAAELDQAGLEAGCGAAGRSFSPTRLVHSTSGGLQGPNHLRCWPNMRSRLVPPAAGTNGGIQQQGITPADVRAGDA